MTLDHTARDVYAIAATPFHEDGAVDWASLDRLTDYYAQCGADGIMILGIMGEAPKLEAEESVEIVRRVSSRSKLPIIVGVSAPGFAAMRSLARKSMDLGAAGVIVAPSPALRTDDQIRSYFTQAVGAIGSDVP